MSLKSIGSQFPRSHQNEPREQKSHSTAALMKILCWLFLVRIGESLNSSMISKPSLNLSLACLFSFASYFSPSYRLCPSHNGLLTVSSLSPGKSDLCTSRLPDSSPVIQHDLHIQPRESFIFWKPAQLALALGSIPRTIKPSLLGMV